MSKIKLYPIDQNVRGGDKWIGTDSGNGQTKNFSVNEVVKYINDSSAIDLQTLRYKFQVLEQGDTLDIVSITIIPPQGYDFLCMDVTEIVLINKSLK